MGHGELVEESWKLRGEVHSDAIAQEPEVAGLRATTNISSRPRSSCHELGRKDLDTW